MKHRNKLSYFIVLVALIMNSCYLDDDIADYGTGPNLVGFSSSSINISAEANGDEYEDEIPISIIGPSVYQIDETITVEVSVIESNSTAEEGVHYRLDTNTIELSPDGEDEFQGSLPITVLTEGIEAPLDENPVISLEITSVSGDNIVINEKTTSTQVTLSYSCPSNLVAEFDWEASGGDLSTTISGSDALVRVEGNDIQYVYESGFFDFGYYCNQYEGEDPGCGEGADGSLILEDQCGELSYLGEDQFGDAYSITNIQVSGNELSFTWESDYGETSNVVLTRTDGQDWPEDLR